MKKFTGILLSSVFTASLIVGCGSNIGNSNLRPVMQNQNMLFQQPTNTKVTTFSRKGLEFAVKKMVTLRFQRMDYNKDGKLSLQEYPNSSSGAFEKIDQNADGYISLDEALKNQKIFTPNINTQFFRDMAKKYFTEVDTNNDKYVSKSEWLTLIPPGAPQVLIASFIADFYLADKNRDSLLNFSEFEDYVALGQVAASETIPWDANPSPPGPSYSPSPIPVPTYPPIPVPTYSPIPVPTYSPIPGPTYPPIPVPTSTPTPIPSWIPDW